MGRIGVWCAVVATLAMAGASTACFSSRGSSRASIEFTSVPEAGPGGPTRIQHISGKVTGAKPKQRIVLFAKSGMWWVQPFLNLPFTSIRADSTFDGQTHIGTEYAAVLADPSYSPPATSDSLPAPGNGVSAVRTIEGVAAATVTPKVIHFGGYEWEARQIPTEGGGSPQINRASNAWADARGWMHLRIAKEGDNWTCAEVNLTRSLGYGTYTFHVQQTPALEPGTVFAMFTWDDLEAGQNHREFDIELSQWGDPTIKNAQFVVQPFYVAANVFRFIAPPASLIYSFHWEPGRLALKSQAEHGKDVAEHVFTSGIPSPGGETVHMKLYIYGASRMPQQRGVEVVIEKFEFLP